MATPSERRYAPRYATKPIPVLIGWRVGGTSVSTRAALVDISMGGAQVRALIAPPLQAGVLVRLPVTHTERPLRATVVSVAKVRRLSLFSREAQYAVRLSFGNGCSYEVFKAAVDGFVEESWAEIDEKEYIASDWR